MYIIPSRNYPLVDPAWFSVSVIKINMFCNKSPDTFFFQEDSKYVYGHGAIRSVSLFLP